MTPKEVKKNELLDALARQPYAFGFQAVLRQLECLEPGRPRIGEARRPGEEALRLGQAPSLAFAPSTLASLETPAGGKPPWLRVFFFGLFGPNGPLPLHLTEYAYTRILAHGDRTFSRFADIFHHRLISLFYRIWADAAPTVQLDRPQRDRFSQYVGSTFGLGMGSLRNRDLLPDQAKLHYAGHLAGRTAHAEGLRSLIAGIFGLPVAIEQFVGHWLVLPEDARWRLGESPETGALGLSIMLGARIWERQTKIRIVLGPLCLEDLRRLLPGGEGLRLLTAVIRNYVRDPILWDVNLILRKEEVPALRLGGDCQLGWTTWLTDPQRRKDAGDLRLTPPVEGPPGWVTLGARSA
jgi:type VI secretion system protein ImpH